MTPALSELVARLASAGRITADDVLALRAQVYGADRLAPDVMEALSGLEAGAGERAAEWGEFLAEAMVDFVVHQEDPPDYVDDAKCDWVMRLFAGDVRPEGGLETLTRILESATEVPPRLASFTVQKAGAAFCAKGRIGVEDVALLRRLVYAGGGEGSIGVSREEAETLFAINHATRGAFNDPAWSEFFAEAVGAAVLAACPQAPESREAALRDEAWLEHEDSLGDFASHMTAKPDLKGAIREILHPDDDAWDEWKAADDRIEADAAGAGRITDDDARWLVGQLSRGRLTEAERRLLAFLKAQASDVSDLLKPLLAAATPADSGVSAPQSQSGPELEPPADTPAPRMEPAPVFGLRRTSAA